MPEIRLLKDLLFCSYSNLAMAHAAVSKSDSRYGQLHYMIRAKLFKGLQEGSMKIGDLLDDEKLKMKLPQACSYCGSKSYLSGDHLIPKAMGGMNSGENLVWACRTCNSSKGKADILKWYKDKNQFPPLLLIRRYLKLIYGMSMELNILDCELEELPDVPFDPSNIPLTFPPPGCLVLFTSPIEE